MIIGGGIRTGGIGSGGAVGLNTFGGSVSAFGFYQNFAANRFVARVPGTQTRTFQETHVYTGGTKWLLKANGFLGSTTAPEEPVLYNTSGTRLGIVLEPAATNSFERSADFANAYWTKSLSGGVTATAAAGTSPDGTTTATNCVPSAVSGYHTVKGPNLGSSTSLCTYSIWAKANGYSTISLREDGVGGNSIAFNLSNGTILWSGGGNISGTIEAWPNGWYRCTATSTVTGTQGFAVYILNSSYVSGDPSSPGNYFTGDGTSGVLLWGAQRENNASSATSYIPTTTASVTRTADSCKPALPTTLASPYSYFLDFTDQGSSAVAINGDIYAVKDLTDGTGFYVSSGVPSAWVRTSGATTALISPATGTIYKGTNIKVAVRAETNNFNVAANNVLGTADASCGVPSINNAQGYLGSSVSFGGAGNINAIYRRYALYSSAIADATLQTMSNGGALPSSPVFDLNYETGVYQYTPVNAGVTTNYTLSTLISSGLMTLTGSPSAKWVRGSNGLLQQVTAGELAIEYDSSGNVLGCINTEPARTNFNTRSADQTNAAWTKTGATASAAGVGPYNNTMTTLTEDTATSLHRAYSTGWSGTGGTIYTISAWLRAGTRRYVAIGFSEGVNAVFVTIDTQTWTISQQATAVGSSSALSNSGKIEDWGGGLYRVSVSGNHVGTNLYYSIVAGANTGTPTDPLLGNTYLGTSSTIICSDFQAEAGSYASSYIPTTSASVTRNADVWTLNLGSWFDNSRWIIASKVYAPRANMNTDGSAGSVIASLEPASGTTDWFLAYLSSTNRIDFSERVGGVTGASGNATTLSFPATVRNAFGYAPSNTKASLNGSTQTLSGTPSAVQAAFTRAGIGNWIGGTNPDQGSVYIQSLNIFPVVPTQDNVNQYAGAA